MKKTFLIHLLAFIGMLSLMTHLTYGQRTGNNHQGKTQISSQVQRQMQNGASQLSPREKSQLAQTLWTLYLAQSNEEPILPNANKVPAPAAPGKQCHNCGDLRAYPSNPCKGLQDQYKVLSEKWAILDLVRGTIEQLQDVQGQIDFYAGIADYISTAATVYTTVSTGGLGAVASKAAMNKIKKLALDQVQSMAMDQLLASIPAPYDQMVEGDLSGAAMTAILAEINKQLAATQAKKSELIGKINKCMKNYNASLASIKAHNAKVVACRKSNGAYCIN